MYIENIVIGKPIVSEDLMFGNDDPKTWEGQSVLTFWTEERNIPKILGGEVMGHFYGETVDHPVRLGIAPSASEVRRNRKELCVCPRLDYMEIKYGKRRLFILVGLEKEDCL